ncbi:MAG: accessory gene regulator B family protein [Lachnospiraceae bacterium]|nr:accessory gene regulator B family protein [Lachnospiraceae bacterium]
MEAVKTHLKEKYQLTNYQIAQLGYLYKTALSEISKLILMGILFHNLFSEYLFSLAIMLVLRCFSGGLHFDTYLGCLLGSLLLMAASLLILPPLMAEFSFSFPCLLLCMLSINCIGPVTSKYRPEYSKEHLKRCKRIVLCFISFFSLLVYIMPDSRFIHIGVSVIILHTLQLMAAKYIRKENR